MEFDYSQFGNYSIERIQEIQYNSYCAQKFVTEQYGAMGQIYGRFGKYLLAMVLFFIIYSILDKIEYAGKKKEFKIDYFVGSKTFQFEVSDKFIKYIGMIKNIFFMTMFVMSCVYYFFSRTIALM